MRRHSFEVPGAANRAHCANLIVTRLPLAQQRYWKNRAQRHLTLALLAAVILWLVYCATPPPDVRHRLSMASAYASLAFLAWALSLGAWNLLRRRHNPVSFDMRRDVGIWAGFLAIAHTAIGLTVHLRGRMWMYFFKQIHPLKLQNTQFGLANYTGLVAALLLLLLVAISNDISLRMLGTRKWKSWQRWTYATAFLTVLHGALFQLIEKRQTAWVCIFAIVTLTTLGIQAAGFFKVRRDAAFKLRNAISNR